MKCDKWNKLHPNVCDFLKAVFRLSEFLQKDPQETSRHDVSQRREMCYKVWGCQGDSMSSMQDETMSGCRHVTRWLVKYDKGLTKEWKP